MPPVKTVASSSDVDNDATAELPVLDVAAYEATLTDPIASTDTWTIPALNGAPALDATAQLPAVSLTVESIPTLQAAELEDPLDLSGTHELPAMALMSPAKPNKVVKATPVPPSAAVLPAALVAPVISVPPSPPLIEEWRAALAAAERRIEELTERARIADAERGVAIGRAQAENAQLREQLAQHLESRHSRRGRRALRGADEAGLVDELFKRADRIATLERELASQAGTLTAVRASLADAVQRDARLETDAMNLRAAVARRDGQIGTLEADIDARQQRETLLRARLDEALASVEPNVPDLRAQLAARDSQIEALRREVAELKTINGEKNADLEVAEESIRNLENEVRDKTGKLEEANVTVEEWRAVIAESQRSILQRDGRIQQLETDLEKKLSSTLDTAAQTGEEIALEGPARVLIRTDGNTDFVHVLGRRTRIGRGADNELVLDTKHVSRYHAVLLAGPVHTTVEDLNSTNGVFVNGKRVARQVLKDGDRVTIGRTSYRYTVRT
jgi:predicted  nucleic acid-binding Zn-ribbon protein